MLPYAQHQQHQQHFTTLDKNTEKKRKESAIWIPSGEFATVFFNAHWPQPLA
jgi:hypothetical protein